MDSKAGERFVEEAFPIIMEEAIRKATDVNEKVCEWQPPEELKQCLDLDLREGGEAPQQILKRCKDVIKYSVKTGHPRFFNQLYAGMDHYSLVARFITEAINPSVYTFEVSPTFVMIEEVILKKMSECVGWEEGGDGIFSPGGSISNMYAVNLARYKHCPSIKDEGLSGMPRLVMFTSEECHYSIGKAAAFLGIGTKNVYVVPADERHSGEPRFTTLAKLAINMLALPHTTAELEQVFFSDDPCKNRRKKSIVYTLQTF
ncbi:Acidic amino acid decarboxylase GADL1 [Acipenser ruthenus]|uniref:Acidic amino acid decarboxylase GADL1 n=1 Tax=Acipenser ruthenus TaxID=7906 RepID=A0A444TZ53_ACIRT|nr:Acidic amino acid decarboxylase GADL1 [Acipenser ruthenus]